MKMLKWTLPALFAVLSGCVIAPGPRGYVGARVIVPAVVVRPYYYHPYYYRRW